MSIRDRVRRWLGIEDVRTELHGINQKLARMVYHVEPEQVATPKPTPIHRRAIGEDWDSLQVKALAQFEQKEAK